MVDACNAYALSVFPFGRDDERPEAYESEIWETGMMVGSGFKVNGSRLMVQGSRPFLPCVINQMKVADGWGDGGEEG